MHLWPAIASGGLRLSYVSAGGIRTRYAEAGNPSADEAVLFVADLKKKGRFQQDVY